MAWDDALEKARERLSTVTPLAFDCGKCCDAACCQGADPQDGMLLFPGEDRYYESCSWARMEEDRLGFRLICSGVCPREERPLACRIFPLVIRLSRQEGAGEKTNIAMDIRAWPLCPLMKSGKRGLREDFVRAVREAADLLAAEADQAAFLGLLTQELEAYEQMRAEFLSGRGS